MAGQGLKYNVDIVMCIDCTGSMGGLLDTVKANALKFYPDLKVRCDEKGKDITECRIRVLGFRDFEADGNAALIDSGFLSFPEQEEDFNSFVKTLTPRGGGDIPENGLEVLAHAINSDWTTGGDRRRHVVVIWTDAPAHPIESHVGSDNALYPQGMPANMAELTDWWDLEQGGKMQKAAKRLILFAPDGEGWSAIGPNWQNTIFHAAKAGEGLTEVDYETIMASVVGSI